MSRRIHVRRSVEQPERVAPAGPLETTVERPRRIDAYIDYFASGDTRRASITSDPDGDALRDGDAW